MSTEAIEPFREKDYAIQSSPLYTTTMVNKNASTAINGDKDKPKGVDF